jgi:hypothetical protein
MDAYGDVLPGLDQDLADRMDSLRDSALDLSVVSELPARAERAL